MLFECRFKFIPLAFNSDRMSPIQKTMLSLLCLTLAASGMCRAQFYNQGSDRANIRWNRLYTGKNTVVFPSFYRKKAFEIGYYADTVAPYTGTGFELPARHFPILLHSENMMSNGFVTWAPRRTELRTIPPASTFAFEWDKQLVAHELRHVAQLSNLYRGPFPALYYLLGEQSPGIASSLMPGWFLEGDAVYAETQVSAFGRGLQPGFTLEYRAYFAEDAKRFPVDKWMLGSYRDYVPDYYQMGYQMVVWAENTYGSDFWGRVLRYAGRTPYLIVPRVFAFWKYERTTSGEMMEGAFAALDSAWRSLPRLENSGAVIPTPATSYTTYSFPVRTEWQTIAALKSDLDKPSRLVAIDPVSGAERVLKYTGRPSSNMTLRGSTLYWTEYAPSLFWENRVFSRIRSYDLRTGKETFYGGRNHYLFVTPYKDDGFAAITYSPAGDCQLILFDENMEPLLCSRVGASSVHGLAWDRQSGTLGMITLSERGMAVCGFDPQTGRLSVLLDDSFSALSDLSASDGRFYYSSIKTGRNEVHMLDIASGKEYRVSESTYGSVGPSAGGPSGPSTLNPTAVFTTYTRDGYRVATQQFRPDELTELTYSRLPENIFNQPLQRWNSIRMDTLPTPGAGTLDDKGYKVKRFRRLPHAFNIHSWAPMAYDAEQIMADKELYVDFGVTVLSQDLLGNTIVQASAGAADGGDFFVNGKFTYNGFIPKLQFNFEYGGGKQLRYVPSEVIDFSPPPDKEYSYVGATVYVPFNISRGRWIRSIVPQVDYSYENTQLYDPQTNRFFEGLSKIDAVLSYSNNAAMASKNLVPRIGYGIQASFTTAPGYDQFGTMYTVTGRGYLPGVFRNDGFRVRASYQVQQTSFYNFMQRSLFPRGPAEGHAPKELASVSVDYYAPLCYPDWGLRSIFYITRLRINPYFDFCNYSYPVTTTSYKWQKITSFGGTFTVDFIALRSVKAPTWLSVYVYKQSLSDEPYIGVSIGLLN